MKNLHSCFFFSGCLTRCILEACQRWPPISTSRWTVSPTITGAGAARTTTLESGEHLCVSAGVDEHVADAVFVCVCIEISLWGEALQLWTSPFVHNVHICRCIRERQTYILGSERIILWWIELWCSYGCCKVSPGLRLLPNVLTTKKWCRMIKHNILTKVCVNYKIGHFRMSDVTDICGIHFFYTHCFVAIALLWEAKCLSRCHLGVVHLLYHEFWELLFACCLTWRTWGSSVLFLLLVFQRITWRNADQSSFSKSGPI